MGRTPAGQTRERIFRFVAARLTQGEPPTIRDVQERFGFRAVQTAREHLERLVDEGRLLKESGRARGYRLPPTKGRGGALLSSSARPSLAMLVPVLGRVQAGAPTTAVEDLEGYVPMHAHQAESEDLFGLRVRGESMRDAGILPGDLVIVRKQTTARSGEIVVALWEDEATVKTLRRVTHRGKRRLELHPANPDFSPIIPARDANGEDWCLLGKVIEVRRFFEGSGLEDESTEGFGS